MRIQSNINQNTNRPAFGIREIITTSSFRTKLIKSGLKEEIGETLKKVAQEFAQYDKIDLQLDEKSVSAHGIIKVPDKDLDFTFSIGTEPPLSFKEFKPTEIYKSIKTLMSNIFKFQALDEHVQALNKKYDLEMSNSICSSEINLPQYNPDKFKPYFSTAAETLSDSEIKDKFRFSIDGFDEYPKIKLFDIKLNNMKNKNNKEYNEYAYKVPVRKIKTLKKFISEEEFKTWLQKSIKELEQSEIDAECRLPEKDKAKELRRQKNRESIKKTVNFIISPILNPMKARKQAKLESMQKLQAIANNYFETLQPEIKEEGEKAAIRINEYGGKLANAGIPKHDVGGVLAAVPHDEDLPSVIDSISTAVDEEILNANSKYLEHKTC